MQVLARTTDPSAAGNGRRILTVDPASCAAALLSSMPPVMWFIRKQMRAHRAHGLSVPQYRALCLLDRFPTASLSHVAEHLGSSQPSASRLIQGLVTRGLVTRKEDDNDRRQVKLVLTTRGKAVQSASHTATQKQLAQAIEHLPEEDRQRIVEAMQILADVFDSSNNNSNNNK